MTDQTVFLFVDRLSTC